MPAGVAGALVVRSLEAHAPQLNDAVGVGRHETKKLLLDEATRLDCCNKQTRNREAGGPHRLCDSHSCGRGLYILIRRCRCGGVLLRLLLVICRSHLLLLLLLKQARLQREQSYSMRCKFKN